MSPKVKPIPKGYHSVTPALTFKDSLKAIEFYKQALDAEVLEIMPSPDHTSTVHAAIRIGDSILMMGDEPADGHCKSAESLGASPVSLYVYANNVDEVFQRAIDAGGSTTMPVADMFWGDRCGSFKDPFGYSWMIATHNRDLTEEQIRQAAQSFYAAAAKQ
jgi:PhnB protein